MQYKKYKNLAKSTLLYIHYVQTAIKQASTKKQNAMHRSQANARFSNLNAAHNCTDDGRKSVRIQLQKQYATKASAHQPPCENLPTQPRTHMDNIDGVAQDDMVETQIRIYRIIF